MDFGIKSGTVTSNSTLLIKIWLAVIARIIYLKQF